MDCITNLGEHAKLSKRQLLHLKKVELHIA
jgi:hypothetical protein